MPNAPGQATFQQAAHEVHRYLSDEIAPLMAAECFEVLVAHPPELTAKVLAQWIEAQYAGPGSGASGSDLVYHALRKLHLLSEFGLVAKAPLMHYIQALSRILVQVCPQEDRDALRLRLSRLGEAETVLSSTAQFLHREAGQAVEEGDRTAPARGEAPGARRTLSLLLERLAKVRLPEGSKVAARPDATLLAQILTTAALQSDSDDDLARHLERIRQEGIPAPLGQVFRALGWSLPGWTLANDERGEPLPAAGSRPIEAMNRIVALAPDAQERAKRWGEMIYAAIEQLNEGRLAQAVSILEAAKRLIAEKKPDPTIVRQVLSQAQEAVSEAVLRRHAEVPEKHGLVRKVLEFFPAYGPEGLLRNLDGEMRRERRKLLLALLECHGKASRDLALSRLAACLGGDPPDETGFFRRNLAFLLRRIPRARDDGLDEEIRLLTSMIARGEPAISAKEAVGALGQLRHPTVERALIDRLRELEREAASRAAGDEAWELMDRLCAALARHGTKGAIRTVTAHAFSRSPALGDTMARFEHLSWVDLSVDPEQLLVLLGAIRELLPSKVLGFVVSRSTHELGCLIQAVSGTPTQEVRLLLQEIAERLSGHSSGEQAARTLAKLEPQARSAEASEALSGDLELFALPNLLQSLAGSQSTGELVLFDRKQERQAAIALSGGHIVRCEVGRLRGADGLYQLLERPFPGTFVFRATPAAPAPAAAPEALDVLQVILEGLRRHDEYQQVRALAPDGIALEAGNATALLPEDEPDGALARAVWTRASSGMPPEACETEAATDAFRVRRLYAYWIEQGALQPRVSPPSA